MPRACCPAPRRLHGGHYLGITVALFSVGRLVSSLLGGWLAAKTSTSFVFDVSLVLSIIGSALYFFAAEFGLWALIVGRILLGIGSGAAPLRHGTRFDRFVTVGFWACASPDPSAPQCDCAHPCVC